MTINYKNSQGASAMKNLFDLTKEEVIARINEIIGEFMYEVRETDEQYEDIKARAEELHENSPCFFLGTADKAVNRKFYGIIETNGENCVLEDRIDICLHNSMSSLFIGTGVTFAEYVMGVVYGTTGKIFQLKTTVTYLVGNVHAPKLGTSVCAELIALFIIVYEFDIKIERTEGLTVTGNRVQTTDFNPIVLNDSYVEAIHQGMEVEPITKEQLEESFGKLH